jgi:hypothetical protein
MGRYEIRVKGRLSKLLTREFERLDLGVSVQPVETVLSATFEDQAALYGMLRRLEGLGLELVELRQLTSADPRDA